MASRKHYIYYDMVNRKVKFMRGLCTAVLISCSLFNPSFGAEFKVGGINHFGLTVTDLSASELFFTDVLGFELLGRDEDYPSVAVANDEILITLWRTSNPDSAIQFDRKQNVGLHHLAFNVGSFEELDSLHNVLRSTPGVIIEFSPEPLSGGPTRHMMIREPSGNRLEFIHNPP